MNIQPTVKVVDGTLGAPDPQTCTLCIEIDEVRFRFCAVEEEQLQCRWLEDFASDTFLQDGDVLRKMKKIVAGHPFLGSDGWKAIRVVVNTNAFTLVPAALFRKEYCVKYLELVLGRALQTDYRVMHQYLPEVDAYNVFSIPSAWSDWLLGQYPFQTIEFYHLTSPLIFGALASHQQYQETRILSACFEDNTLTLLLTEPGQLLYCNRFTYGTSAEVAYLVLFALNQLGFLPEQVKLYLYGEITPYADTYTELARFLPQMYFGQSPAGLNYPPDFEDIPGHRYFGLLNTRLMPA
jgi:hypothetical protein